MKDEKATATKHDWATLADVIRDVGRERARRGITSESAARQSFLDWSNMGGFVADREPFSLETWRYLRPIYSAVPMDPTGLDMVIMKAAQGGASILALLWTLWLALRGRCQIGYYLPTGAMALFFSMNRFVPLVRVNPEVYRLMGDPDSPRTRNVVDEGSASVRRLQDSLVYFTHLGGKITTEALPLDALVFDEVQEMSLGAIEKAEERLSASPLRAILRLSTANFAGGDIDYFFQASDQREFHTRCRCPEGVVLSRAWDAERGPLCIDRGNGSTPGVPAEWFFVCPRCGTIIIDPQDGRFIPHNPGANRIGYQFSQLLSPRMTPSALVRKWEARVDPKTFYNRVLGLPYTDPASQPVSIADLRAAQRSDLRWGPLPAGSQEPVFMGVDQMGHDNRVVIKARCNGRMRLLWVEVIQDGDPFRRCAQLMRDFGVSVCAVEANPNFNEAHRFAHEFPGKVFVVSYKELSDDLVNWGDRVTDKVSVRHTTDDARSPYTATVDQFRMMAWSLGKWNAREVDTPDARTHIQTLRLRGGAQTVAVCQGLLWEDLLHVALVTEPLEGREDERRYRRAVKKIGRDPHLAFANMLADVAYIRDDRRCQILFVEEPAQPVSNRISATMQQLYDAFPEMRRPDEVFRTCETCVQFDVENGVCKLHNFYVKATEIACPDYCPAA
jgi:hypothetical protein